MIRAFTILVVSAATAVAIASSSMAQAPIAFVAVEQLPPLGAIPQLIGANPAIPGKWPATYVFKNTAGGGCTATAIGPRVVITAAHCMDDGAVGRVTAPNGTLDVKCQHHTKYPADISADFALCLANGDLPEPKEGYEKVNLDAAALQLDKSVTLLGYGCRTPGGGDKSFGVLFEGAAVAKGLAINDNYIRALGGAALCFGDSGGGAYVGVGTGGLFRRLFAVNSRGDISANSWLSVTHKPDFVQWAEGVAVKNSIRICGLHADAKGCRQ